ncbi:hypothetical protein [Synechococcus sp. UW140]|uniref:hypothetical protein n=1 Tax=Synechococcus sp. UW140 TaxID=368503 RepID=UPI003137B501
MAAVISVIATSNGKETDGSPAVFSFSRTGDTASALSVSYQLFGTAKAGSDYTGNTTGTINFAAGSTSATLSLPALADGALIDPYETIIARINPATNYEIATGKQFATATITAEGMVVIPKGASYPGRSSGEVRNNRAFAALKTDGSVIAWGDSFTGGSAPAGLTVVSQIFSNYLAFAALKTDGSVIAWGDSSRGGSAPAGLTGVSQIFSNGYAFAALKTDGSVIAWGESSSGGSAPAGLTGVSQIFSTYGAFAALKTDGSVIAWGESSSGGVAPAGLTGVSQIFSTGGAFAALKTDGSVIAWGGGGGSAPAELTGVSQIFSNYLAFAALKTDGSVIAWGDSRYGGSAPAELTGVSQIFSTNRAFAALKTDGSVVSWGSYWDGSKYVELAAPAGLTGVSQIFSTYGAFAALKTDGSVIAWGESSQGGSAPAGLTGVVGFANPYTDDRLILEDKLTPTYTLTPSSATTINEGAVLTNTVTTTNVTTGTKFYYALSGTGITTADFSAGALTGEGITDATGKFTFTHTLANDLTTEGAESLSIKLYSDTARTLQVGSTATVSVADTSISYPLTLTAWTGNSQLPTTTVSENLGIINFRTSDLPAFSSKNYYWLLSGEGVTKDDFLNSGTFTSSIAFSGIVQRAGLITQPGPLALSFQFRQDEQYENESITLSLFSDAQMIDPVAAPLTIRILDSHTYTLTPSLATINEGAVLTSTITTTNVASGTTLYYSLSGNGITTADFSSGALTGTGTVASNGSFAFSHTLANDLATEGSETLNIKLFSDSSRLTQVGTTASVSIADTSINPFNLDIDGDGKVTALGDGLMIIRKLFGAAFTGDALTNKAISPTATRTTAEIHQFIESGISTGTLDVDKDGKTTALGDGLMVIRHLFGAAFAGAALTNKAISPDSPYFGPPANFAAVAANIDAMRPI